MKIVLTPEAKEMLEKQHRTERDGRVKDRIKAVLLRSEDWRQMQIAQALRIRPKTVSEHLNEYVESQKLKPENGGSQSKLNTEQAKLLALHISTNTYVKACDVCKYVETEYSIVFTVSGMTKWLRSHGFSYKQPKGVPSKADPEKQKQFIETYESLVKNTPDNEPIEFGDGVHPTMATKVSYGWIRTGQDKPIETTASRTRLNLMGSINLETMEVTLSNHKTIDSKAMDLHFEILRHKYPKAPKIHLILDQGPYNKSQETKRSAERHGIILHYLPSYSPNLNPIERLWKVMNEQVRNNRFFPSAKEFRRSILDFFEVTWPNIAHNMVDRINDNFRIVEK